MKFALTFEQIAKQLFCQWHGYQMRTIDDALRSEPVFAEMLQELISALQEAERRGREQREKEIIAALQTEAQNAQSEYELAKERRVHDYIVHTNGKRRGYYEALSLIKGERARADAQETSEHFNLPLSEKQVMAQVVKAGKPEFEFIDDDAQEKR